ncbi:MAG: substrate-binding domain-containing protein, partial [Synergistaceae bacterium]|nr:substrate-binding domain-containing protein [Synergistaceae bacterium]
MKKFFSAMSCAVVLFTFIFAGASFAANEFSINGSTTILPFAQSTAEAFMKLFPDVRISVSGGGSGNGAKALIDGTVEIASMSRTMKDSEITDAKANNVNPLQHVVAVDCILPVVHPSNPVNDLTVEQLKEIFAGNITNW